jgi:hypothetical protein
MLRFLDRSGRRDTNQKFPKSREKETSPVGQPWAHTKCQGCGPGAVPS